MEPDSETNRAGGRGAPRGTGRDGPLRVGLVAPASLQSELVVDALRREGLDVAVDPSRPVALVLPPASSGELHGGAWSARLDGVGDAVPMVVLAPPSVPVHHLLAHRIRSGTVSILDASTASVATLVSMLHLAADGRQVVDPPFLPRAAGDAAPRLSGAEWAVLELLAAGLSNAAIARRRFVGERTVETHVRQIFHKLGLADGADVNRRVIAARMFLTGELDTRAG